MGTATITLYMRNETDGSDYVLGTTNTTSYIRTLGIGSKLYFQFFASDKTTPKSSECYVFKSTSDIEAKSCSVTWSDDVAYGSIYYLRVRDDSDVVAWFKWIPPEDFPTNGQSSTITVYVKYDDFLGGVWLYWGNSTYPSRVVVGYYVPTSRTVEGSITSKIYDSVVATALAVARTVQGTIVSEVYDSVFTHKIRVIQGNITSKIADSAILYKARLVQGEITSAIYDSVITYKIRVVLGEITAKVYDSMLTAGAVKEVLGEITANIYDNIPYISKRVYATLVELMELGGVVEAITSFLARVRRCCRKYVRG